MSAKTLMSLLALCDRILVLSAGRITGILDGRRATKRKLAFYDDGQRHESRRFREGGHTFMSISENSNTNAQQSRNNMDENKQGIEEIPYLM